MSPIEIDKVGLGKRIKQFNLTEKKVEELRQKIAVQIAAGKTSTKYPKELFYYVLEGLSGASFGKQSFYNNLPELKEFKRRLEGLENGLGKNQGKPIMVISFNDFPGDIYSLEGSKSPLFPSMDFKVGLINGFKVKYDPSAPRIILPVTNVHSFYTNNDYDAINEPGECILSFSERDCSIEFETNASAHYSDRLDNFLYFLMFDNLRSRQIVGVGEDFCNIMLNTPYRDIPDIAKVYFQDLNQNIIKVFAESAKTDKDAHTIDELFKK